eukprot:m.101181 g.101181  ORF g.101181 m.101181 type:complete len:68 (-) comp13734_c0_seq7:3510-3713(-)
MEVISSVLRALDYVDRKASGFIQSMQLSYLEYVLAPGGFMFGWAGNMYIIAPTLLISVWLHPLLEHK